MNRQAIPGIRKSKESHQKVHLKTDIKTDNILKINIIQIQISSNKTKVKIT